MEEEDSEFSAYFLRTPKKSMHSILKHATILVSDSQTMTSEAAVLGTPSVRINTFVGKISYLTDLEKLGLTKGYFPYQFKTALNQIQNILQDENYNQIFINSHKAMLELKSDPTSVFVETILSLRLK
jgi:predicted glycosyltransferase